jgi:cell division protein FtsB
MKSSEFTVRGFELRLFLISTLICFTLLFPAVLKAANDAGSKESEIAKKEAELKTVEENLKRTNIRVQNLHFKSLQGTISSAERSMLQQNMVKKRKLVKDKNRLEEELKALREGKEPPAAEKKEPEKPQGIPYGKPPGSYSY